MTGPFQAVALDYDGTLTDAGQLRGEVLDALGAARQRGLRVVLATGRILDELRAVFPDVDDHVDLVVAENGAVLSRGGVRRRLAAPVDAAVDAELVAAGVPFRRGDVLLATTVAFEPVVSQVLQRLGLDSQLIRNGGELMVVPTGVTKGSGVRQALTELGVSWHDTIAAGDAENDVSMLSAVQVGVAVANAIDSVKAHADVVLLRPDGEGVRLLLSELFLAAARTLRPARVSVPIGYDDQGRLVRLPAAGVNILVSGPSSSGKSYVAGLIAEQLIRAEYSLLITDPEGDYGTLRTLRGVGHVGSTGPLPTAAEVASLLSAGPSSLVVDMSGHSASQRQQFYEQIRPVIQAQRMATGVPHWILVDEAHEPFGTLGALLPLCRPDVRGFILVSYLPHDVAPAVLDVIDIHVRLAEPARPAAGCQRPRPARAVIGYAASPDEVVPITLLARRTQHVRHWHKYLEALMPADRGFHWRWDPAQCTGAVSRNLVEFHREIARCAAVTLRHHAAGHDMARWIAQVIADDLLASSVGRIEDVLIAAGGDAGVPAARQGLLCAVEDRYL